MDCVLGILYATTCFRNLGDHDQNMVICLMCVGDPNRGEISGLPMCSLGLQFGHG